MNPGITEAQIDTLKELLNIGIGRAAGTLNQMLGSRVVLQVPEVKIFKVHEIAGIGSDYTRDEQLSVTSMNFKGSFFGVASVVFPMVGAVKLVSVLTGEEPDMIDIDSIRSATLSEVGNIVLNGVMGSITNVLDTNVRYSVPRYTEDTILHVSRSLGDENAQVLIASMQFTISDLDINGNIFLFFEVKSFDNLITSINRLISAE